MLAQLSFERPVDGFEGSIGDLEVLDFAFATGHGDKLVDLAVSVAAISGTGRRVGAAPAAVLGRRIVVALAVFVVTSLAALVLGKIVGSLQDGGEATASRSICVGSGSIAAVGGRAARTRDAGEGVGRELA